MILIINCFRLCLNFIPQIINHFENFHLRAPHYRYFYFLLFGYLKLAIELSEYYFDLFDYSKVINFFLFHGYYL